MEQHPTPLPATPRKVGDDVYVGPQLAPEHLASCTGICRYRREISQTPMRVAWLRWLRNCRILFSPSVALAVARSPCIKRVNSSRKPSGPTTATVSNPGHGRPAIAPLPRS